MMRGDIAERLAYLLLLILILAACGGVMGDEGAGFFRFDQSEFQTDSGTNCVAIANQNGLALSCDWPTS